MRSLRLGLLIWLSAFAVISAFAQAVQSTPYRLRPLDDIQIQVYNEAQINVVLPVLPDGRISAPFAGLIEVAGKTTSEVESLLVDLYKEKLKLKDPKVSVMVIRYRQLRASVTGMALQPGKFEDFRPGETLLNLLSKAGGYSPDRADLYHATLIRGLSREVIPIDLNAMLIRGDMSQNYEIEDGDVLNIPEDRTNRINVTGTVFQAGVYPYKEPMYLVDAITQAHGATPRARVSQVTVIRKKAGTDDQLLRIKCNLIAWRDKGDIAQNILLMPGDTVYVPETNTPDFNSIGNALNSLFIVDRLLTGGFLGLKLFGN